jgi:hypothetical protein
MRAGRKPEHEGCVNVERSRIGLLAGAIALALSVTRGIASHAAAEARPGVTVYRSPT